MAAAITDLSWPETPSFWCNLCSRMLINLGITSGYEGNRQILCPCCNSSFLQQIRLRRFSFFIPLRVAGQPPTSSSRSNEEYYLGRRQVLISPSNQASVVPSTNFDRLVMDHINLMLQGRGLSSLSSAMPASEKAVNAMVMIKVEDGEAECAVCLERFNEGGEARELPCKHGYHEECILKWLATHSTCPLCRFQLPVQDDQEPVSFTSQRPEDDDQEGEEGRVTRSGERRALLPVTVLFGELMS